MKLHLRYIITVMIILHVLVLLTATIGWAADDTNEVVKARLVEMINNARQNPLSTAAEIGLNPVEVLASLPELADILQEGLPAFKEDPNLGISADKHTREMLANDFFGKVSLDGSTYTERIGAAGYKSDLTDEIIGLLGFFNFIESEKAAKSLFRNMFSDELDPARRDPRVILNPNLEDIGVGVGTGIMSVGTGKYNAYIVTCDFGKKLKEPEPEEQMTLEDAGVVMLHLINQARNNPRAVARAMAVDLEAMTDANPDLLYVLSRRLPPLSMNEILRATAVNHTMDMAKSRFFDKNSSEGLTPAQRIKAAGYLAETTGETIMVAPSPVDDDLNIVVTDLFERLFRLELTKQSEQYTILNPELTETGIGLGKIEPAAGDQFNASHLVTCDFGAPEKPAGIFLLGVLYRDLDKNGLYTPGEGLRNEKVLIDFPNMDLNITTDITGGFQLRLGTAATRLTFWPDDVEKEIWVNILYDNALFIYGVTNKQSDTAP